MFEVQLDQETIDRLNDLPIDLYVYSWAFAGCKEIPVSGSKGFQLRFGRPHPDGSLEYVSSDAKQKMKTASH